MTRSAGPDMMMMMTPVTQDRVQIDKAVSATTPGYGWNGEGHFRLNDGDDDGLPDPRGDPSEESRSGSSGAMNRDVGGSSSNRIQRLFSSAVGTLRGVFRGGGPDSHPEAADPKDPQAGLRRGHPKPRGGALTGCSMSKSITTGQLASYSAKSPSSGMGLNSSSNGEAFIDIIYEIINNIHL